MALVFLVAALLFVAPTLTEAARGKTAARLIHEAEALEEEEEEEEPLTEWLSKGVFDVFESAAPDEEKEMSAKREQSIVWNATDSHAGAVSDVKARIMQAFKNPSAAASQCSPLYTFPPAFTSFYDGDEQRASIDALLAAFGIGGDGQSPTFQSALTTMLTTEFAGHDGGQVEGMLDRIGACFSSNPYLIHFLTRAAGLDLDVVPPETLDCDADNTIRVATAYTFVLHVLTSMVSKGPKLSEGQEDEPFAAQIRNAVKDMPGKGDMDSLHTSEPDEWRQYASAFEKAKIYGVNAAMTNIVNIKLGTEEVPESWSTADPYVHTNGKNSDKEDEHVKIMSMGLTYNIFEAMAQDTYFGFFDNAWAGTLLAYEGVVAPSFEDGDTGRIRLSLYSGFDDGDEVELTREKHWQDLYSTWNAAFVSTYKANPFFYAKLFNPAVLCYDYRPDGPDMYMYHRVIALWLHANFELSNRIKTRRSSWFHGNWRYGKMTKSWGESNRDSAKDFESEVISLRHEGENPRRSRLRKVAQGMWKKLDEFSRFKREESRAGFENGLFGHGSWFASKEPFVDPRTTPAAREEDDAASEFAGAAMKTVMEQFKNILI